MGGEYLRVPTEEQPSTNDTTPTPTPTSVEVESLHTLKDTMDEVEIQIKRSSSWVYVMITFQIMISFWFPSLLLFFLNLIVNFIGFVGVQRRNRGLLGIHFGYTIGLHCIAWFILFYTLFYAISYAIIAILPCLIQSIGLRHERALIALIAVAPTPLERVAVQQEIHNAEAQQQQEQQQVQLQEQPKPVIQHITAMPAFTYAPYGQQTPAMEQPLYPGMYPGFYPIPQMYPGYFPQQGGQPQFTYLPFPAPLAPPADNSGQQ